MDIPRTPSRRVAATIPGAPMGPRFLSYNAPENEESGEPFEAKDIAATANEVPVVAFIRGDSISFNHRHSDLWNRHPQKESGNGLLQMITGSSSPVICLVHGDLHSTHSTPHG